MVNHKRFWPILLLSLICVASVARTDEADLVRPDRDEVRRQLRRSARFAAAAAAQSDAFRLRYTLPSDAHLSVTLLDLARMPIRTFHVPSGEPGAREGENTLTVWDGKDSRGLEAPAGEYWAALSFRYPDGTIHNKRFRIQKP
jgi:hypothetical protein